jgi:hypothetical protein
MKKYTVIAAWLLLSLPIWGCGQEEGIPPGDDLSAGPVSLDESSMSAKVVGGALEIYFPLANVGGKEVSGKAEVTCRHLTEDEKYGGSGTFVLQPGEDTVAVHLKGAPTLESAGEEAEYVVSYRLDTGTGTITGKRSLFMLIDKADLVIMVPDKLLEGQTTMLRAFLHDPRNGLPLKGRKIELTATLAGKDYRLEGTTDDFGLVVLDLPAEKEGTLEVKALVVGDGAQGSVETQVTVVRESRLLLTSDKPIYQPGQTMHLRALALNRLDKAPLAGQDILFEVMDSKGNKVFKRLDKTNEYGIGWAQFDLATQVLMGSYTLRATIGEVVSEKTVTVDRYALPKFKVNATLDKAFYQPGQELSGEVQADYFFGKPVDGGAVKVTVFQYVAEWTPATVIEGKTNDAGLYKFTYKLPDYLIGQPLEDGKALVMIEIAVTDTAEHEQKVAKTVVVANSLLDIVLIPESGEVVPDVWNWFYLFVTDPTGAPVQSTCTVTVNGAELDDEGDEVAVGVDGPGKVQLLPHKGALSVEVAAVTAEGDSAARKFDYDTGTAEAHILLRTDKAIYKVGGTMQIDAWVTGGYDHIFLDVVRKNQTVLTKTLEVKDGKAQLLVDVDSELSEDLVVDAYMLADNGQFIRDTRVVFVQPADDLAVAVTTDKEEYLPGEQAKIAFEVKDAEGNPAPSALGIQVVDEAVFALAESNPGLMKLYFMLEAELQEPTYQIGPAGGFSLGGLFTAEEEAAPGSPEEKAIQDTTLAAFAAMEGQGFGQNELSSWKQALADLKDKLGPFFDAQKEKLRLKLELQLGAAHVVMDSACGWLKDHVATHNYYDYWDHVYTFNIQGQWWDCKIEFTSRGPDEVLGSEDDWTGSLDLWALAGEKWAEGERGMPMAGGGEVDFADEDGQAAGPPNAEPDDNGGGKSGGGGKEGVKVRSWFPETLYIEPALITDNQGKASVEIPMADSITEWRMTTLASSSLGQLGSRTDGIVVFQDFFVDIDFPKFLTQNDEIQFPVAVYNYLPGEQTVSVELQTEPWFDLMGEDKHTLKLEGGEVTVVYFPVRVVEVGWHSLTVYGMGDALQDAIKRTVEVKPDGKEMVITESARFDNDGEKPSTDKVSMDIPFPENAIAGSQSVVVKVLPGLSTHIVEGMESMLQLPGG